LLPLYSERKGRAYDMSVENDGKTKEDWYNDDKILSKWGFTDSKCHCCGVDNSNLDGLLMQVSQQ